jgi:hypothetical protein
MSIMQIFAANGDEATDLLLKISSFVIGSFKNSICYDTLVNSVIMRL